MMITMVLTMMTIMIMMMVVVAVVTFSIDDKSLYCCCFCYISPHKGNVRIQQYCYLGVIYINCVVNFLFKVIIYILEDVFQLLSCPPFPDRFFFNDCICLAHISLNFTTFVLVKKKKKNPRNLNNMTRQFPDSTIATNRTIVI